jgi:hypothetical protein
MVPVSLDSFCFALLHLVSPMVPVSLECPYLISLWYSQTIICCSNNKLNQTQVLQENFEDIKGVIRSHQWKDRQENVQNLVSWFFWGGIFHVNYFINIIIIIYNFFVLTLATEYFHNSFIAIYK